MGNLKAKRFSPSLFGVLITLIFVGVFCSLGVWQKNRGDARAVAMQRVGELRQMPASSFDEIDETSERYTPVYIHARAAFDHQILLENQIHSGRVGYLVYSPVEYRPNRWVLVNRGWVPAPMSRQALPDIELPDRVYDWTGHIDTIPRLKRDIAGTSDLEGWPKRVPVLKAPLIESWLGGTLSPWIIRLNSGEEMAYQIDWIYGGLRPEKHWSYAMQWFALALGVLGVFIAVSFKRVEG